MSRNHGWSNLCPDILRPILKVLNSKDFHRARTVCSNWYSVSRTCIPPLYPWRILFRKPSTLLLFDTGEEKVRVFEHPELDLSENHCIASSGSWLLMLDRRLNFNILNVFTRERIDLPTMELSFLGSEDDIKEWECLVGSYDIVQSKKSTVLWINERTRDFVVAWVYERNFLFTFKKGDETWRRSLEGTECNYMTFKDHKLYVLTWDNYIKILDLSGEIPRESLENPLLNHQFSVDVRPERSIWRKRITITNSGEFLVIQSSGVLGKNFLFEIFKMNMESSKWERVDSIGDEMLIFGHGVTVRSSVNGGSICFVENDVRHGRNSGVFDLATSTITWAKDVGHWDATRWFVPGYG
ncbi:unnamed protein product [Thlaspi arvense]|uniref:F-box domain-containing protein n=1 Tax=Thlaspi arvense TaxID=13288 RepID=A0AAU9S8C8_THLAR|nr:unnamed protein product [Thlaspi arvense]